MASKENLHFALRGRRVGWPEMLGHTAVGIWPVENTVVGMEIWTKAEVQERLRARTVSAALGSVGA
jgi:hypothetical protein